MNTKSEVISDFLFSCELYEIIYNTQAKVLFYYSQKPMTQIDPTKVAEVAANLKRKPIVSSACIGCGACVAISGEVFEIDQESGYSIVLDLSDYEGKDVDDSIVACPVSAISWSK